MCCDTQVKVRDNFGMFSLHLSLYEFWGQSQVSRLVYGKCLTLSCLAGPNFIHETWLVLRNKKIWGEITVCKQ